MNLGAVKMRAWAHCVPQLAIVCNCRRCDVLAFGKEKRSGGISCAAVSVSLDTVYMYIYIYIYHLE